MMQPQFPVRYQTKSAASMAAQPLCLRLCRCSISVPAAARPCCIFIFRNMKYHEFMEGSIGTEQAWSKTLFGNRFMLQLAGTIMTTDGAFTGSQLALRSHIPKSTVHRLLVDLFSVGLIAREPQDPGSRALFFRPLGHPFWEAVSMLSDVAKDVDRGNRGA